VEVVKKKKDSDDESGSEELSGSEEDGEKTKKNKKKAGSDEEEDNTAMKEKEEEKEIRSSKAVSENDGPEIEDMISESQSESSEEEETEQQANEREYIDMAPTEPEVITYKKMRKIAPSKQFDGAKCIFVNYTFENDYNHILAKLVSLFSFMPSTL
jgi:hypothetical protein